MPSLLDLRYWAENRGLRGVLEELLNATAVAAVELALLVDGQHGTEGGIMRKMEGAGRGEGLFERVRGEIRALAESPRWHDGAIGAADEDGTPSTTNVQKMPWWSPVHTSASGLEVSASQVRQLRRLFSRIHGTSTELPSEASLQINATNATNGPARQDTDNSSKATATSSKNSSTNTTSADRGPFDVAPAVDVLICRPNQCSCVRKGIPASGVSCPKHGAVVCNSCDPGYQLLPTGQCVAVCSCKTGPAKKDPLLKLVEAGAGPPSAAPSEGASAVVELSTGLSGCLTPGEELCDHSELTEESKPVCFCTNGAAATGEECERHPGLNCVAGEGVVEKDLPGAVSNATNAKASSAGVAYNSTSTSASSLVDVQQRTILNEWFGGQDPLRLDDVREAESNGSDASWLQQRVERILAAGGQSKAASSRSTNTSSSTRNESLHRLAAFSGALQVVAAVLRPYQAKDAAAANASGKSADVDFPEALAAMSFLAAGAAGMFSSRHDHAGGARLPGGEHLARELPLVASREGGMRMRNFIARKAMKCRRSRSCGTMVDFRTEVRAELGKLLVGDEDREDVGVAVGLASSGGSSSRKPEMSNSTSSSPNKCPVPESPPPPKLAPLQGGCNAGFAYNALTRGCEPAPTCTHGFVQEKILKRVGFNSSSGIPAKNPRIYHIGFTRDLSHFTEQCGVCKPGFSLNRQTRTCDANRCICENGQPKNGVAGCSADGAEDCGSCDPGYFLVPRFGPKRTLAVRHKNTSHEVGATTASHQRAVVCRTVCRPIRRSEHSYNHTGTGVFPKNRSSPRK